MKKNAGKIVVGIILVILGVLVLLQLVGVTNIEIFFNGWWTLFIIVPSIIGLFKKEGRIVSLLFLLFGVALLLAAQNVIDYGVIWKLLLPVLLVAIGLKLIFGSSSSKPRNDGKFDEIKRKHAPKVSDSVVFASREVNYNGQRFEGIELDAVFGSMTCDLRNAIIEHDSVITVSSVFGSAKILTPPYVNVMTSVSTLFGGVSENRPKEPMPNVNPGNALTLYIEANAVFGSVEIL